MKIQANAADETLVVLYAQGNNEAFDILLNRYKDRLYAYIYYTCLLYTSPSPRD